MVNPSSALDRFRGPDGVCSEEAAAAAGVVLLPTALASTVISTDRKLAISGTREQQYGQMVTSAVAKLQPDHGKSSYAYFGYLDQDQGISRREKHFHQWNPETPSKAGH
jgi:hypothetical protein